MDIKKIIQEEIRKILNEESVIFENKDDAYKLENYPAGAANDPSAPWNQDDNTREGDKADEIKFKLIWTDDVEFAFFKGPDGKIYVMNIDAIDQDEFEPYADREEEFEGFDEDGDPILSYGDWEIDGYVIENYVNDNLDSMRIGEGLEDYENGEHDLVMLDRELAKYFIDIAKYIKDEKERENYLAILNKGFVNEGGVTDNLVNKNKMNTPTDTLFTIRFDG